MNAIIRKSLSLFLALALALGLVPAMVLHTSAAGTINLLEEIPDDALRQAIFKKVTSSDPITSVDPDDLTSIAALNVLQEGIEDITGIKYLTGLGSLDLTGNLIEDISELANLTSLRYLTLSYNDIDDISELANLTSLRYLTLSYNDIEDISALENLTNLNDLNLSYNEIDDISALANLTNLNDLNLSYNDIDDISALTNLTALNNLDLSVNSISNISALGNLTNLYNLDLTHNEIEYFSALGNLTNLNNLNLSYNEIDDISALANLTNLGELNLSYNYGIDDISALANLTDLIELDLNHNSVDDISALENLTDLNYLNLSNNGIGDISDLSALTRLTSLDLSNNGIGNIGPLSALTNLTELDLDDNQISDISALSGMSALESLFFCDNQISDISVLTSQSNLTSLGISNNPIVDVTPIQSLTGLIELLIAGCGLTELDLSFFPGLNTLDCSNNQLTSLDISDCSLSFLFDCTYNNFPSEDAITGLSAIKDSIFIYSYYPQNNASPHVLVSDEVLEAQLDLDLYSMPTDMIDVEVQGSGLWLGMFPADYWAVVNQCDDTAIATVDADDELSPGTTTLTVTAHSVGETEFIVEYWLEISEEDALIFDVDERMQYATTTVTVKVSDSTTPPQPGTGPNVDPASLDIITGQSKTFTVSLGQSGNEADEATITGNDTGVATVDITNVATPGTTATVTVTGVSQGSTDITVAFSGGSYNGGNKTVHITVTDPAPEPPTLPAPPTPQPEPRDRSSGGRSNTRDAEPDIPSTLVVDEAKIKAALAEREKSGANRVRIRHNGKIRVPSEIWPLFGNVPVDFDTTGSPVQVRVSVREPDKMTGDKFMSGYVKGSIVDSRKAFFEKWFKNEVRAIHFDQQGNFGQPVEISAKLDLNGMDTENLYFYSYNSKTKTYRRIEKTAYWIDKNGYLHFTTEYAGDIVVSDGPLERK